MSKTLQETRKSEIPKLIERYNKLVSNIFSAVTKQLPTFEDFTKDGEIVKTAEQQMYSMIEVRNKALDNANEILQKINELENELHNPEYYNISETQENPKQEKPTNTLRKYTKK